MGLPRVAPVSAGLGPQVPRLTSAGCKIERPIPPVATLVSGSATLFHWGLSSWFAELFICSASFLLPWFEARICGCCARLVVKGSQQEIGLVQSEMFLSKPSWLAGGLVGRGVRWVGGSVGWWVGGLVGWLLGYLVRLLGYLVCGSLREVKQAHRDVDCHRSLHIFPATMRCGIVVGHESFRIPCSVLRGVPRFCGTAHGLPQYDRKGAVCKTMIKGAAHRE